MSSTTYYRQRFDSLSNQSHGYARLLALAATTVAAMLMTVVLLASNAEAGAPSAAISVDQHLASVAAWELIEVGASQTVSPTTATVTASRLNVRSGPSTTTRVIGQVKAGDKLTLVRRNSDGSWVQAQSPLQGWVSARYINPSGTLSALPEVSGTAKPEASLPRPTASALTGHIVFQDSSGGTIRVIDLATGELRALTSGAHPALSPDGKKVAFIRGGGDSGLWTIDLDGSNLYRLYEGDTIRTPTWSPDGQWIAFSRITGYDKCRDLGPDGLDGKFGCVPDRPGLEDFPLVETPIRSLGRVDLNGGNFRDIPSMQRALAPSWGKGGIVYQDSSPSGLQLTADAPNAGSRSLVAGFLNQDPEWQPGADRIVYQSEENGKWQIVTINSDGSGRIPLTGPQSAAGEPATQNVSPTWSPDGRHLLFLSDRGGRWALWTMNTDGSGLQQLPVTVPIEYRFALEQVASWGP